MISAFGVEHSVSKGLPSAMRVHAKVGHPAIIGYHRGGPADDYITHRVAAHWYGKDAARAEGVKRRHLKAGTAGKRVKNVVTPKSGDTVGETDVYGLADLRATGARLQGQLHRERSRELR